MVDGQVAGYSEGAPCARFYGGGHRHLSRHDVIG